MDGLCSQYFDHYPTSQEVADFLSGENGVFIGLSPTADGRWLLEYIVITVLDDESGGQEATAETKSRKRGKK
jgi:hypothetical protein